MYQVIIESPAMVKAVELAKGIAPKNVPVLISGETGTGKEVLAHIIHDASGRTGKFVPVNCAALPKELVESELFGSMKGSYTGAHADRIGLVEQAKNGTLFLDELSELPSAMQAKLLRVLQDKRVRPVGCLQERPVDFRLIVALNTDPHLLIERRKLRSDLFYRINVIDIHLPPLRERLQDILPLATMFLAHYGTENGSKAPTIDEQVQLALAAHPWPGNVRQLQNEMMRLSAINHKTNVAMADLSEEFARSNVSVSIPEPRSGTQADCERRMVLEALKEHHGVIIKVAKALAVSRATVYAMIKRHGLGGWVRIDPRKRQQRPKAEPPKLEQTQTTHRAFDDSVDVSLL